MSYRLKAALCGVLAVFASTCAHATLDEAAQAMSEGDYGTALQLLDAAPASERDSVEGRLLQAAALAGDGKLSLAEEQYRALIERSPAVPEAYNNLAVLYAHQGKLDEARKLLEKAMRTNPSYATIYDNLSDIYLEMSRTAYAKALQLDQQRKGPTLEPLYAVNSLRSENDNTTMVASASPEPLPPPPPKDARVQMAAAPEEAVVEEAAVAEEAVKVTAPEESTVVAAAEPPESEPAPLVTAESEPSDAITGEDVAEVSRDAVEESTPKEVVQETSSAPAEKFDEKAQRDAIVQTLKQWAADWAGQNVEGYLNSYTADFQPGKGLTHEQWLAQRRKRLSKPEYIDVQLGDFAVRFRGEDRAIVDLVQHYRSDRYSDLTRKRFRLIRNADGWKIASEKTIEVL